MIAHDGQLSGVQGVQSCFRRSDARSTAVMIASAWERERRACKLLYTQVIENWLQPRWRDRFSKQGRVRRTCVGTSSQQGVGVAYLVHHLLRFWLYLEKACEATAAAAKTAEQTNATLPVLTTSSMIECSGLVEKRNEYGFTTDFEGVQR